MRSDLQPMSIGDVFDNAFDLYKHNFALFAGITAVVHVPTQVAFSALVLWFGSTLDLDRPTRSSADVGAVFVALGILLLLAIVSQFLTVLYSGALTIAVSERILDRPMSIGEAYRRLKPSIGRLIGAYLLIGLLLTIGSIVLLFVFGFIAVIILGLVAMAVGSSGEPGVVVMIVVTVIVTLLPFLGMMALFTVWGIFATQAVTVEGSGAVESINRNWSLVRGRFWRPFLTLIALIVLFLAMFLAIEGSLGMILTYSLYSWLPLSHLVHQVIQQGIATVLSLFLQPFIMVVLTMLYFDQRMRREGFDIELALYEREAALALAREVSAVPEGTA